MVAYTALDSTQLYFISKSKVIPVNNKKLESCSKLNEKKIETNVCDFVKTFVGKQKVSKIAKHPWDLSYDKVRSK